MYEILKLFLNFFISFSIGTWIAYIFFLFINEEKFSLKTFILFPYYNFKHLIRMILK